MTSPYVALQIVYYKSTIICSDIHLRYKEKRFKQRKSIVFTYLIISFLNAKEKLHLFIYLQSGISYMVHFTVQNNFLR